MAPKQKITKEIILEAAFKITREMGFENVNARSLANVLGCSTQPIYSRYTNMDELKKEIYDYAAKYFDDYAINRAKERENFLIELGHAYIGFAKGEVNLFKLLFMTERLGLLSFSDMYSDKDNLEVAINLSKELEINLEEAKEVYLKIWIFNHGVATMIANETIRISDLEAEKMIDNAYEAFISQALNNRGGK